MGFQIRDVPNKVEHHDGGALSAGRCLAVGDKMPVNAFQHDTAQEHLPVCTIVDKNDAHSQPAAADTAHHETTTLSEKDYLSMTLNDRGRFGVYLSMLNGTLTKLEMGTPEAAKTGDRYEAPPDGSVLQKLERQFANVSLKAINEALYSTSVYDMDANEAGHDASHAPLGESNATHSSPPDRISTAGVAQGNYGDCFFESSLASLAQSSQGRDMIEHMVKRNGDGSSTVTFPGDPNHPVNVTSEDIDRYKVENSGNFANVIETAFLKYDNVTKQGWMPTDSGTIRTADDALRLLTGNESAGRGSPQYYSGQAQSPLEDLATTVQTALRAGRPVVAASDAIPDSMQTKPGDIYSSSKYPIAGGHEYSVTGFNPQTGTITVRNPWGDNWGTPISGRGHTLDGITNLGNGKLSMSLNTFATYFNGVRTVTQQSLAENKYLGAIE